MGGKCKCPPSGPNNGYLISFGDTMTALLAFFIVLNSLAEEQTGAKLHAGTGSFIRTISSFGLNGVMSTNRSEQAFQLNETSPEYIVPDPEDRPSEHNATGPDDVPQVDRIQDREEEQFHRYLQELRRLNSIEAQPAIEGEVAFDVLEKLSSKGKLMNVEVREALNRIGPMLRRSDYNMEIVVWATTPSESAWSRAIDQSDQLRNETIAYLQLNAEQQRRLSAVGRTWISSKVQRPSVSITLRRIEQPGR